MSLPEYDRVLIDRCLAGAPQAWEDFTDRFLGLVLRVVQHAAENCRIPIDPSLRDDLAAEVFLRIVDKNFAVLRRFRRQSSLHTYIAVIARRVVIEHLRGDYRRGVVRSGEHQPLANHPSPEGSPESRLENRDEVEHLLLRLDPREARIVRMYHLEKRSYKEISSLTGMPENSIGPVLTRARLAMRQGNSTSSVDPR